jgi:hypothetical protein
MSLELQTDTEIITSTSNNARGDDFGNLCTIPPYNGFPSQEFLTSSGASSGTINNNLNFTVATDIFHLALSEFRIYSLVMTLSTPTKINQTDYGSISGGLTNGINYYYKPNGLAEQKLNNHTIKTNDDYCILTPEFKITQFEGTAQTISILLDIRKLFGVPLVLKTGDKFIVRLQDNFTSLSHHVFCINGMKIS